MNIVLKSLSSPDEELSKLKNELKNLKSTNDNVRLNLAKDADVLGNLQDDLCDLRTTSEKIVRDSDALNNLQEKNEIKQFEEKLILNG